jgi:hypothetical protein
MEDERSRSEGFVAVWGRTGSLEYASFRKTGEINSAEFLKRFYGESTPLHPGDRVGLTNTSPGRLAIKSRKRFHTPVLKDG